MDARTLTALAGVLLLWSSAFAAIGEAVRAYEPGPLALLRFVIASATLGVYALARGMRLPDAQDLRAIVINGLLGITIYHLLLNYGQVTVPPGAAAFLIATAPVFTALIARMYLKERLKPWGWLGILISLAGVPPIAWGRGKGFGFDQNALLILGAAFCSSLYFVLQKPLLKKYTALEFTTYVIWAGTLSMLFFLPAMLRQCSAAPLHSTLLVAYLGIFPGALAYVLWTYVLAHMPASRAVSFLYLSPVLATLIAWLFLGEQPGWLSLAGGTLTLTGVVVVNRYGRPET